MTGHVLCTARIRWRLQGQKSSNCREFVKSALPNVVTPNLHRFIHTSNVGSKHFGFPSADQWAACSGTARLGKFVISKALWKTAAWLWKRYLPMPACPLGLWNTVLHNDLKLREVSARWVPRMLINEKRLHASQCVRKCYHVTRVWIVLTFHQLSQWMRLWCRCSILKPNGNRLNGSTTTQHHRRNFGLPPMLREWW